MNKLEQIFAKQRDLAGQFEALELRNNCLECLLTAAEPDLDDQHLQMKLRRYAWQVAEEIEEAIANIGEEEHLIAEEVADAFHFLVELAIHAGLSARELFDGPITITAENVWSGSDCFSWFFAYERSLMKEDRWRVTPLDAWHQTIYQLAITINQLKNRPWRTDIRHTDRRDFVLGMHLVFKAFVRACLLSEITSAQLYESYFAKAEVNQQRIHDQASR